MATGGSFVSRDDIGHKYIGLYKRLIAVSPSARLKGSCLGSRDQREIGRKGYELLL